MEVVFWISYTHLCYSRSLIWRSDSNLYRDTFINRACHAAVMSILDHRKIYQLLFRCSSGGYEVNKMYLFITHVYLLPWWDSLHNLHEHILTLLFQNDWHLHLYKMLEMAIEIKLKFKLRSFLRKVNGSCPLQISRWTYCN